MPAAPQENRPAEETDITATSQRILRSETFRRCPRLRDFLTFVVKCSTENRVHEINEYSLGVQVFAKPADYNPNQDNIVRATARQLRTKLAEYYASEGASDEWLIEIPKGAYVPVWRPAFHEAYPQALAAVALPAPPRRTNWVTLALAIVALSGLITTAVLLQQRWRGSAGEEVNLLTRLLADPHLPPTVVLDDPYLPVLANWSGKSISLKDYLEKQYARVPAFDGPQGTMLRGIFQQSVVTSASTAQVLARVVRAASQRGQKLQVRHCRDLQVRELESGNFIFFGGLGSNPWVDLLQKDTNFQHFFEPASRRGFQNKHPLPNEPAQFSVVEQGDSGRISYARVALFKSPMGSGQVALIGGTSGLSTEAAGEFALSPSGLAEVRKLCPETSPGADPAVEVILETTSLAGSPVTAHVVAHRCTPVKTNSFPLPFTVKKQ